MGGKQSRQQREQKQQQAQQTTEKRKQRKDKKSSKRGARTTTPPEEQQTNGTGCNEDVVVVAADVAASDSPVNVTESDGRRCVNEHTVGEDRGEGAGGGSSVTTITICMLKMEPNETSPVEDCPTNGGDDTVGAGATAATGDVDESVEVSTVTPTPTIPASTVGAELLTMAPPRCGCFENGNCSGPAGGQFTPTTTTAMSVTATNNTTTHPIVASGPIPTIKKSKCNCNTTPILIGTPSSATIDNRLNNNNNELRLADSGPTVVLTMPGGPTPTTTSSLAAATSASMPSAASSLTMWSSNLPTAVSSSSSGVASPARSQSFGNFMLTAGGGGDSLAQQLLNRLRHHHHHHHHHHHNHHLMHFLHNHHHHHHGPMDAAQPELASELATGGSNTPDWRHQVLRQWNPTVPPTASESVYGLSPSSLANRATASGGPVVAPSSSSALISPTMPFMDIDLKDKLEGLELGPRTPNNNHSPQPTVDTTGEHPRTVGECPTCCAMAMAANGGSGSSIGLVNTTTTGTGVGTTATAVATATTAVYNGNVGEVEEKILNTANQQQQTAGPRMSPPPPASDVTPPSTESATGSTKAVPSTVASLTAAAAGSSTQSDAGKDDAAAATRTVTAPAAVTAAGRDQIVVDGNSPKQTTAAASSNVAPTGSVAPTSDSTSTTTVAAASSSTRLLAKTTPATTATTTTTVPTSSSSTSVASSPGGQCCRKQSPSSGSSSAAATLLHTLSLSGRRSRNSSTTPPCSCTCCCGNNNNNNADVTVEPAQSRSAFTNWISGGQKAADRNSTSAVPSSSGSNTKSKKPNWRVSLNCTIRRAAGGGSSSGGGTAGPSGKARSSTTSEKFPVGNAVNNANNVLSSTGGDLGHNNNSIASASGSTSHRGSSLISSSVSAKLLKSETDKDDTCVCTAYRKMSESPPPPPQLSGGTVSPGRPLSPPLPTSPATDDPSFIPLNMLSLVASGGTGGGATTQPQPAGMSLPVPAESFSSLLHNHHHHLHHHHHHAMAAAALVAADHHHHPSFFFPTSTAATTAGGSGTGPAAHVVGPSVSGGSVVAGRGSSLFGNLPAHPSPNGVILLSDPSGVFDLASDDFSLEDCDERARIQRELEIREGVDAPPNFHPRRLMSGGTISAGPAANHPIAFFYSRDLMQRGLLMANRFIQPLDAAAAGGCPAGAAAMAAAAAAAGRGGAGAVGAAAFGGLRIHSQVDFIHCLVPDLQKITSCSFYWGKMDRYEAERLLEGKPEGTFLLRDSAQEEFLFSVSFRKYNRSLHARIEQFNHKFSFDSRDPGVYTASTVTGLLEHYKDPSCVMFFEPMLTYPLNRNFSFSLQQLCRAAIVSNTTYDGINELALPKSLKAYLKEYHYRQRVRFRPLDEHLYSNA